MRSVRSDDLIVLLEIARCGSFLRAGNALGLDHSTISRRVGALERELRAPLVDRGVTGCTLTPLGEQLLGSCEQIESALAEVRGLAGQPGVEPAGLQGLVRIATTEAFGAHVITPILAALHRDNPRLLVEIVTQTRLSPYGVGADIEIGLGDPVRGRAGARALTDYRLGLYASDEYLGAHGAPTSVADLEGHSLIYYVEGLLRVEDLHLLGRFADAGRAAFAATSVEAQTVAAVQGAGIGLLPAFVAERRSELRRVLFDEVAVVPTIHVWVAARRVRRPAATRVMAVIEEGVRARQEWLLPAR